MALINKLSAIGNAIREKTGKTDLLTLDQMPEEIKGIETGSSDNWYDTFWDAFQQNGERDNYNCGFYDYCSPNCWDSSILYPKYDIKGTNFANCFRDFKSELDLSERLKELNVILDTSKATSIASMFRGSDFTKIPAIDLSGCDTTQQTGSSAGAYYMFAGCSKLHTIEKIISKADVVYLSSFVSCSTLENITFEGVINRNIGFPSSPKLSSNSVNSIINALSKVSEGETRTITFHSTVKGNLTETQIATITTDKGWTLA